MGGPANLNEEDVVHSNSTSTNPSLIPPNQEADEVVGLHISVTWHAICQLSIGLCKKSVVRL